MQGLSSERKEKIKNVIERFFDNISFGLLGNIPQLRNKDNLVYNTISSIGLANIFISALGNRHPNAIERDMLKGLLSSSFGYFESIKHNTQSNVTEQIDGLIRQSKISNEEINENKIQDIISEELKKAKNAIETVVESETTKYRNLAALMLIVGIAASVGEENPNVFFSIIRDSKTCQWCLKNHLNPDGNPKIFKLSEVKQSYLSTNEKKEGKVSVAGQHPRCRCFLSYVPENHGFKRGKLQFISNGYNAHSAQS